MIAFLEVISLLKEYKEEYGDLLVPKSYTTENGIKLGCIVRSIRCGNRETNAEEKAMLDSIGFVWKVNLSFDEVVYLLKEYKDRYGDLLVPQAYTTEDGIKLGWIVSSIRIGHRQTSAEEKTILNSLGFVWKLNLSFEETLIYLKEYKDRYGNLLVPRSHITEDGIKLGRIVSSIRCGTIQTSDEEKKMLDSLGFVWKIKAGKN